MATSAEIQTAHKRGIGGSEVSAILGLDDYSSPYKVWLVKTGREPAFQGNKYTVAGTLLEPVVVEYFQRETKYRVIKSSANQKLVVHPKYEFAIGYRDRIYCRPGTIGRGVLECKTTQKPVEETPETWFSQLQWYLGISSLSYGAVAWLERGLDFKYSEYDFDPEYFDFMIERVKEFWEVNILKDIPPDPINVDDVVRMYTRHIEGAKIKATPEQIKIYNELVLLRAKMKTDEAREEELVNMIKFAMKDNEVMIHGTRPLFTWKATAPSNAFDLDRLKENDPDVYNAYRYQKPGVRKFLIKVAKDE